MYKILLIFILIFFSSKINAECSIFGSKRFQETINDLTANFPSIKIAENNLELSKEQLKISAASFDPLLGFDSRFYGNSYYSGTSNQLFLSKKNRLLGSTIDMGYRDGSGSFPIYENIYQTASRGEFFTGITIPLLRNMRIDEKRLQEKQREIDIKINNLLVFNNQINLTSAFSETFVSTVMSNENINIIYKSLVNLKGQKDLIEKQVTSGLSPQNDLIEFERFLLKNQSLMKVQNNELDKQLNLINKLYLGNIGENITKCQLPKSQKELYKESASFGELVKDVFANRPDFLIILEQLKLANIELQFANNQTLPELNYRLEYSKANGDGPEEETRNSLKNIIQLNFPIFNREANADLSIAKIRLENIGLSLKLLEQNLSTELFGYLQDLQTNIELINITDREINIIRRLLDAELISYQSGNLNLFLINQRNGMLLDLELERNQLYFNYYKKIIDLYLFLNQTADLDKVMEQMIH